MTARRLLAALALVAGTLAVGAAPALASTASDAKRATDVLTGTVIGHTTTPRRRTTPPSTTYDVEVRRVYKGDLATGTVRVVSTRTSRACSRLLLRAHVEYVLFATRDGADLRADSCSGTARAASALVTRVEGVLGDGRPPTPPKPERAAFTRVADSAPPTLTRTAAPGLALVIAGLLGLFVVRRVGRGS